LGGVPDDPDLEEGPKLAPDVTMPEHRTAQRVGTSKERSPSRWAESLRPTACERDRGLPPRRAGWGSGSNCAKT
jgi:hypothetical protein